MRDCFYKNDIIDTLIPFRVYLKFYLTFFLMLVLYIKKTLLNVCWRGLEHAPYE